MRTILIVVATALASSAGEEELTAMAQSAQPRYEPPKSEEDLESFKQE